MNRFFLFFFLHFDWLSHINRQRRNNPLHRPSGSTPLKMFRQIRLYPNYPCCRNILHKIIILRTKKLAFVYNIHSSLCCHMKLHYVVSLRSVLMCLIFGKDKWQLIIYLKTSSSRFLIFHYVSLSPKLYATWGYSETNNWLTISTNTNNKN